MQVVSQYGYGANASAGGVAIAASRSGEGDGIMRAAVANINAVAIGPYSYAYASNISIGNTAHASSSQSIYLRATSATAIITSSSGSWSVTSDARDKTDFEILEKDKALMFINTLNPLTYSFNPRERYFDDLTNKFDETEYLKGTKKNKRRAVGFKAQEVYSSLKEIYKSDNYANIVDYDKYDDPESGLHNYSTNEELNGLYTMRQAEIIPFLVAAIQQQNKEIEDLKSRLNNIENNQK